MADVRYDGVNKPAPKGAYWPVFVRDFQGENNVVARYATFAIRTPRAGSRSLMEEVQKAVWSVDPSLPLAAVHTLGYFYRKSMARTSFALVILACAGRMALLLGAVGLYGVLSYAVSRRTHEIGIRMALGAQHGEVLRLVLGEGARIVLIGVAVGLAVAVGVTRLMTALLYGVRATDPLTFTGVAGLLIVVALAAYYVPARRATRLDPIVTLRCE